ncbi:MAG: hypothetical protein AB8F94_10780 [Saprospiraceae bacterium]
MKTKIVLTLLLSLISLMIGCKPEEEITFDFSTIPSTEFIEHDLRNTDQIILNANILKNQLYFLSPLVISKIHANGENGEGRYHNTSLTFFKKYCLGKNYMALSFPVYDQSIRFHSTIGDLLYDEIYIHISRIATTINTPGTKYKRYNFGFDNVAISDFNEVLLPVVKSTDSSKVAFVLFDLEELIDSAYVNNYYYPEEDFIEILLPEETTKEIHRIEFFQKNFYVSTNENTYMIRPDGSFKLLTVGGATDFFEYDGKIYADFGDRIGFTSDDGETWEEKNNTPTFDGFREFEEVYDHLVFFYEDDLYQVNIDDFSYSILKNKGLEGSKITAVMPFRQSIYVATLSGLFYKSIEELK